MLIGVKLISIIPIVLAGGSGTRLWPLSRQLYPKQFLPLVSDRTMLHETIARMDGLQASPPLMICGESHRFTVAVQMRSSGKASGKILLEPAGRNTAPAVALAALYSLDIALESEDPLLLVLPADHVIHDLHSFRDAVTSAIFLRKRVNWSPSVLSRLNRRPGTAISKEAQ